VGVGVGSCACVSISEHRTTPIIARHNPASAGFFIAARFLAALLTNFPNTNKTNPEVVRFIGGLVRRGRRTVHARRARSQNSAVATTLRIYEMASGKLGIFATIVSRGVCSGGSGATARRKRALTALADSSVNLATGHRNRLGQ
jgi:hypothetical protein